jgi:hypothetical protein
MTGRVTGVPNHAVEADGEKFHRLPALAALGVDQKI